MSQTPLTVGLLYPGEMGSTLAALLRTKGVRIVSLLANRSERTRQMARRAGVIELDSLAEVARQSRIILSLVPPSAAEEVADSYCRQAASAGVCAIYVDANAISPELAESLSAKLEARGHSFVDASINGLARTAATTGTLFLSGASAGDVADLFDGLIALRVLGPQPGLASAMKMMLSGLSKGVCALFVEMALLAQRRQMLGALLDVSSQIYPGITAVAQRMMPTIPQHRLRRAEEMRELEQTALASAQSPRMIASIRQLHEEIAELPLASPPAGGDWTAVSLIQQMAHEGLLAGESPAGELVPDSAKGGCRGQ